MLGQLLQRPEHAAAINMLIDTLPKAQQERFIRRLIKAPDLSLAEITGNNGHGPFINGLTLVDIEWPEPVWAIPDLIPAGLTFFAGKSKLGKSWFMMQIALTVACGGVFFGKRVEPGRVGYLALEDSERRMVSRTKKQGWTKDALANTDFLFNRRFHEEFGSLNGPGADKLANYIDQMGYRMVVIDTFSRALQGDQNDVAEVTSLLSPIQMVAQEINCAIVMIDHHRKGTGEAADAIGDILGSTGKGAVADTALGLYRERGKPGARLTAVGRDIEETTYDIYFDRLTGCWQLDESGINKLDPFQADILSVLEEIAPAPLTKIIVNMGLDKDKDSIVQKARRALIELEREGKVRQVDDGQNRWKSWDIVKL